MIVLHWPSVARKKSKTFTHTGIHTHAHTHTHTHTHTQPHTNTHTHTHTHTHNSSLFAVWAFSSKKKEPDREYFPNDS